MRRSDKLSPARPPRPRLSPYGPFALLRASFVTGLIVIAPIGITVWLIWTLTGWMDSWVLPLIPPRWRPEHYIGINLRGLGAVVFLVFTVLIGWLARGMIGRWLVRQADNLMLRMPIIGRIHGGIKHIAETILSEGDPKFDQACLVEFPRKNSWAIGFITGEPRGELAEIQPGRTHVAVFVPTSPNPTTGYLVYVPDDEVQLLEMSPEDAFKLIFSAGLVYPPEPPSRGQENSSLRSTVSR